jgi:hypothetical protein
MDYTVQRYEITLEVRDDGFVNLSISFTRNDGEPDWHSHNRVTLDYAIKRIEMHAHAGHAREE